MKRQALLSILGLTVSGLLLVGTSRLQWTTNQVVQGPELELTAENPSLEFNVDLSLEMCEPGPQGEPVSLFLDLSAGFDLLEDASTDTAESSQVSITLYPSDGSPAQSDAVDLSDGSSGGYVAGSHIQCPAFGTCERSYVVVFEASEGVHLSGWWTLTASAMGDESETEAYEGSISIEIEER